MSLRTASRRFRGVFVARHQRAVGDRDHNLFPTFDWGHMRALSILLTAVAALAVTACSTEGLNFRADERVQIISPEDEAVVREPVTIDWEVRDFEVTGPDGSSSDDRGYFLVMLDRFPQPPGEPLTWFAKDDLQCRQSPRCPSRKWYAERGVFTTTETSFELPVLPRPPDTERAEIHQINIALLDGTGRRIGEGVWIVDLELERRDA